MSSWQWGAGAGAGCRGRGRWLKLSSWPAVGVKAGAGAEQACVPFSAGRSTADANGTGMHGFLQAGRRPAAGTGRQAVKGAGVRWGAPGRQETLVATSLPATLSHLKYELYVGTGRWSWVEGVRVFRLADG